MKIALQGAGRCSDAIVAWKTRPVVESGAALDGGEVDGRARGVRPVT
jgi:hypothetical protein